MTGGRGRCGDRAGEEGKRHSDVQIEGRIPMRWVYRERDTAMYI